MLKTEKLFQRATSNCKEATIPPVRDIFSEVPIFFKAGGGNSVHMINNSIARYVSGRELCSQPREPSFRSRSWLPLLRAWAPHYTLSSKRRKVSLWGGAFKLNQVVGPLLNCNWWTNKYLSWQLCCNWWRRHARKITLLAHLSNKCGHLALKRHISVWCDSNLSLQFSDPSVCHSE